MNVIDTTTEILFNPNWIEMGKNLEVAARTCYKSEARITDTSADKLVRTLVTSGHHSVLEHQGFSVRLVCDRGVSHEFVRHRLASYSQESTRYVDYNKNMFTVVRPWCYPTIPLGRYETIVDAHLTCKALGLLPNSREFYWLQAMLSMEGWYKTCKVRGGTNELARGFLPHFIKTEVVVTMNLRAWRRLFEVRALGTTGTPHPAMLAWTIPLLHEVAGLLPCVFEDLAKRLKERAQV
jgi:thymidylate synthase (FAD)